MPRSYPLTIFLVGFMLLVSACGGGSSPAQTTVPSTNSPTASPSASAPAVANLSTSDLVQRIRPSVVQILTEAVTLDIFGRNVSQGAGTGFILDTEGHIVTNNHVVVQPNTCDRPVQNIVVTLADGRKPTARIVGRDPATDLAVIKIDEEDVVPVTFGDSDAVRVGEEVVAIGNALGLPGGPTVTKGVASAKDRQIEEDQPCGITIPGAIQTDAAINPGNSGGPLLNMRGEVIGITTAIIAQAEPGVQAQGIGLAISSNMAKPIVQEIISKGRVERGVLGIVPVQITPSLSQALNLPVDRGIGLDRVQAGGPAARAGLRDGDIIVKIGDVDINTSGDLFQVLMQHRSGERVLVEYYRGNNRSTADVTLG